MAETVIQPVLGLLEEIGVDDIFGVPGDFAFPVQDAIVEHSGYARIRGVGAVSTTYGVGELSAISAVAGSYAEHVPVFHLTGSPTCRNRRSGRWCTTRWATGNSTCSVRWLIAEALYHRRPVYMAFPSDVVDKLLLAATPPLSLPTSYPESLATATEAVIPAATERRSGVWPGVLLMLLGLQATATAFVDASGLPFATIFSDKAVLGEDHPGYIGMYDGRLMDESVRGFVESCDVVLTIGTLLTDFNIGAFTARLDLEKTISIGHHRTAVGAAVYQNVEIGDILAQLARRVTKHAQRPAIAPGTLGPVVNSGNDPITADALYPRWADFFRPNDVIITETGTSSMGLAFAQLPKGAEFHNQTLWGAIGWATPAAFGAAVAAADHRLILVTGEGSHQLTAQEISQIVRRGRRGLRPIIIVLNNSGYLIERLLCKEPAIACNDAAAWNYTCGELDDALQTAAQANCVAYIEVVTDAYEAPLLPKKLHESLKSLYHF